jgi:superfamily II DNA or RNA helicase
MNNDLKFFTNEADSSLLDRFKKILENDTQFFDVLVGYFRSSGFYQLYPSLEGVEKVRILVGLNIDKVTYQVLKESSDGQRDIFASTKSVEDGFEKEVTEEVENAPDTKNVEDGLRKFIEYIQNKKLEIRVYPEHPIHAKVYILRKPEGHEDYGKVITGSSNFSQAGLVDNLEFNVELKDKPDVAFALQKFEELWAKSVDVSEKYIDTVKTKTWINDEITPYELYLKFLYEYFREKINYDQEMFADLPKGYLDLEYQKEAVADALLKISEHNGVFLSDVVGLGKTYISTLIAKKLGGQTLVICPPVLKEYWEDTMREFGVVAKVESHGKLDEILAKGVDYYDQVIIDEAHRFRNEITQSFETLHQICAGKKVILVTATPLNNRPKDIASQMFLFQKKNNSTIPNHKNLKAFFDSLEKKLDPKLSKEEFLEVVKENSELIRDEVLKYVMVRRTRGEVEKFYKEDMEKQGLRFPKVQEPFKLYYSFDEGLDALFTDTLAMIKKISYARYEPANYLKTQALTEDLQIQKVGQENVRGFMKGLLVKRLDSSFYAFRQTLDRFINSYDKFIEMFEKGTVFISKKVDVYDYLEWGLDEELLNLVEESSVIKYDASEFQPNFKELLMADRNYLKELLERWNKITVDPKLDELKDRLNSDEQLKSNKILIFTESKETGRYLSDKLKDIYGDEVVNISGGSNSAELEMVKRNFDPKDRNKEDEKRILVTTDVLSEGINLHRANIIINYDIPWNSIRILQRVGRVNRVGSKHGEIFIYNFFPTSQSEEQIGLEKLAVAKIQAFHDTLGEDTQYLTGDEVFNSWELFSHINSSHVADEESDENVESELGYLKQIRKIRDEDEKLYQKIRRLPAKCRTARGKENVSSVLVTFFRRGSLRKFFQANEEGSIEVQFGDAVKLLYAQISEPKKSLPGSFYDLLGKNISAFEESIRDESEDETEKRGSGSDKTLMRHIKALLGFRGLTEDDEVYLSTLLLALEEGAVNKRSINQLVTKVKDINNPLAILSEIRNSISESYLIKVLKSEDLKKPVKKEIILSEAFV